jgi:hypothetical protein
MRRLLFCTVLLGLISFLAMSFPVQREASVVDTDWPGRCTDQSVTANVVAGQDAEVPLSSMRGFVVHPALGDATKRVAGEPAGRGRALTEESPIDECTAGVADGDVTVDGRPLLWKLRNQVDIINDVHYFAAGVEHHLGLGPAIYSYLGMGPANDTPEGPVRQGLNSQGVGVGFNVLQHGGWQELHHQALGHYDKIGQVRAYLNGMTDLSTFNYFVDAMGEAGLWENQTGIGQHWEYNTRATARDSQWIDVDNGDADNDPWTGGDVSLSGWVVRANAPAHYNADNSDDIVSGGGRYVAARDTIAALIYNNGRGTALSAESLAEAFFRHNVLALDTTVSSMIIHGVLPTEDPRLSTMWALLGHSKTGIFVPVWIHGVESGGLNEVPQYLDSGDDGVSVYTPARGMFNAGYSIANVQARTLPFEQHLFDVVYDRLLPEWRVRNWADPAEVTVIGEEMKRVQEQIDADAYSHLQYLYDQGPTSNYAPTISMTSATTNGLEATFSVMTEDADQGDGGGDGLTYLLNYGDGQTGFSATHEYAQSGRYLVSCRVTDANGVSQTDWIFVVVGEPTCDDGLQNQGEELIDCGGPCAPCACLVTDGCDASLFRNGAEMCDAYGECQIDSAPCPGPFRDEDHDVCFERHEQSDCCYEPHSLISPWPKQAIRGESKKGAEWPPGAG